MVAITRRFKVRLVSLPKAPGKDGGAIDKGKFRIGRRYRVYGLYDNDQGILDFLLFDDKGEAVWVNASSCRKG